MKLICFTFGILAMIARSPLGAGDEGLRIIITVKPGAFVGVTDNKQRFIRLDLTKDGLGTLKVCSFQNNSEEIAVYGFEWQPDGPVVKVTNFHCTSKFDFGITAAEMVYGMEDCTVTLLGKGFKQSAKLCDEEWWNRGVSRTRPHIPDDKRR